MSATITNIGSPRSFEALGRAIADARNRKQISQRELSRRVNVTESYFGGVEKGKRQPEPAILQRTAVALEMPYATLAELAGYAPHRFTADEFYALLHDLQTWLETGHELIGKLLQYEP